MFCLRNSKGSGLNYLFQAENTWFKQGSQIMKKVQPEEKSKMYIEYGNELDVIL
jgi:hypothetical protein